MRTLLVFFLSFSLVLNSLAVGRVAAAENNGQLAETARFAFLEEVIRRTVAFQTMNSAELLGLDVCINEAPNHPDCQKTLGPVYENIRLQYPEIRRQLLIYNMLEWVHLYYQKYSDQQASNEKGFSFELKLPVSMVGKTHPLNSIFQYFKFRIPFPEYTADEFRAALSEADTFIIETKIVTDEAGNKKEVKLKTRYRQTINGYLQKWCSELYRGPKAVCSDIELKLSSDGQSLYFSPKMKISSLDQERIRMLANVAMAAQRSFARGKVKAKILELASWNPYAMLVSSATPKREELSKVIHYMYEQSLDALDTVREKQRKYQADPSEGNGIDFFEYNLVVKDVLAHPEHGPDGGELKELSNYIDLGEVEQGLKKTHSRKMWVQLGVETTVIALGSGLCLLVTRGIGSSICLSGFALGFNGYFLAHSYSQYSEAYQTIFGSPSGEHYVRDLDALSSAETSMVLAIAFLPLGGGAIGNLIKSRLSTAGKAVAAGLSKAK